MRWKKSSHHSILNKILQKQNDSRKNLCDETVRFGIWSIWLDFESASPNRNEAKLIPLNIKNFNTKINIINNWVCVWIHYFVVTVKSGCHFPYQLPCLVHIQNQNLWTHRKIIFHEVITKRSNRWENCILTLLNNSLKVLKMQLHFTVYEYNIRVNWIHR